MAVIKNIIFHAITCYYDGSAVIPRNYVTKKLLPMSNLNC